MTANKVVLNVHCVVSFNFVLINRFAPLKQYLFTAFVSSLHIQYQTEYTIYL